jgi:hypothetical protein
VRSAIADRTVFAFVDPDGTRRSGSIAIGAVLLGPAEWSCRVVADGVTDALMHHVSGIGALVEGLELLATQLHEFLERGGRVLEPLDESDARLDLAFGAFWPTSPMR